MLKIRKAKTTDARFIALLGRITFSESFKYLFRDKDDLLAYLEITFSVNKIKSSLQKENNIYWIALYKDLPVGYAKLKLNSRSEFLEQEEVCQLQKIYVLKDYLSMKIGFKLQNLLLQEGKNRGFRNIWLSVYDGNLRAINFYERNGFKPIGTHNFQIGKENFKFIAMAKELLQN
ncbi:GNAT family N-acetyltransferase [Robiginitalea sp. IMCC43444]|uniref:GNAT family N-acetyltransferase n=1 Tax=Robiginitalea sp. IMCC43444 TaxID=3459121 RepID=UPI004042847D